MSPQKAGPRGLRTCTVDRPTAQSGTMDVDRRGKVLSEYVIYMCTHCISGGQTELTVRLHYVRKMLPSRSMLTDK